MINTKPTFEQLPEMIQVLLEKVNYLEERLNNQKVSEVEQPVNVQGAADHLGLNIQTVYRMLRDNRLPAHKKFSQYYFYKSELNKFIKEQ